MYIIIFLQVYLYLRFIHPIFVPSFPFNKEVSLTIRRVGNDREDDLKYPFI